MLAGGEGFFDGCAVGEGEAALGNVGLHGGEGFEADAPAFHVAHGQDQDHEPHAQGDVAQAQGAVEKGTVDIAHKVHKFAAKSLLKAVEAARLALFFLVGEVRRQDEERLDQRDGEGGTDHQWNHLEKLAPHAGDKVER